MLAIDLVVGADLDLQEFTRGPTVINHTSICDNYERPRKVCSVVGISVPSAVGDILWFARRGGEAMSR